MSWIISKDKYRSFLSQTSSKWREKGNASFTAGHYDDSIEEYTIAMLLADHQTEMPPRTCAGPSFMRPTIMLVLVPLNSSNIRIFAWNSVLSNRSAAYIELGLFAQAMEDAARSILIDPNRWRGSLQSG